MKRKKTMNIQISAAMIMALLGVSLCRFSQSYISFYDKPLITAPDHQLSRAEKPSATVSDFVSETVQDAPASYIPSLTSFNLASLYGEGDSQEISLGEEITRVMSEKDSKWISSIYQLAEERPEQLAAKLQLPSQSFQGVSFHKVDISFYDEDGKRISPRSNIQEILSMANTYFYYHAPQEYDGFLEYSMQLWEKSHSLSYSISDIYYCDGSLDGEIVDLPLKSIASPAQAAKELLPETSAVSEFPLESNDESGEVKKEEPESIKGTGQMGPGIPTTEVESIEESKPMETENVQELPICHGHADLHIKAVITGLSQSSKSLFSLDSIGNMEPKEAGWTGWTQENKNVAKSLADQDWMEAYGLTLTPSFISSPLSYEEIDNYMNHLPESLSQERRRLIHYALSSVGRVPYYWGGKPGSPGYDKNHFGAPVTPDEKGRSLKGLDCSGWISWIYWSALQKHLSSESTAGLTTLGTGIQRKDLQPGDIIVRTGTEGHVVMFLCWESNGDMTVIHESSALVDNVTVTTMKADWSYYRKLVDE